MYSGCINDTSYKIHQTTTNSNTFSDSLSHTHMLEGKSTVNHHFIILRREAYYLIGLNVYYNIFTANSTSTQLFVGEPGRLVPSASHFLTESDLFMVTGRMIGHLFFYGGPCLRGLCCCAFPAQWKS